MWFVTEDIALGQGQDEAEERKAKPQQMEAGRGVGARS